MEKYDKDVEAKQHELDVLKASKAKDLERLQELTKLVGVIDACFEGYMPVFWIRPQQKYHVDSYTTLKLK